MANFQVIRHGKLKGMNGLIKAAHHNLRTQETPNARPEDLHLNQVISGARSAERIAALWRDRIKVSPRKVRADAVYGLEYVLTASPEAMGVMTDGGAAFFKASLEWVEKRHGKDNVLQAVIHRDETTPHLHVVVIPLVEKERKYTHRTTKKTETKKEISLDCKTFTGGRKKLQEAHDSFFEGVASKFGLERGQRWIRPSHEEIRDWVQRCRTEEAGNHRPSPSPTLEKPRPPEWVARIFAAQASGDTQAASKMISGAESMFAKAWLADQEKAGRVKDGLIGNRAASHIAKTEAKAEVERQLDQYRERPRGEGAPRGKTEKQRGRGEGAGWED